jgi:hypothetical protein
MFDTFRFRQLQALCPLHISRGSEPAGESFSLLDRALGKCNEDWLEVRMPTKLKAAIAQKAKSLGFRGGSSEAVRFVMAKWAMGEDHVSSLIEQELSAYGLTAHISATTDVRTDGAK